MRRLSSLLRCAAYLAPCISVCILAVASQVHPGIVESPLLESLLFVMAFVATGAMIHVVLVARFQRDVRHAFRWRKDSWRRLWHCEGATICAVWTSSSMNGVPALAWISPLGIELLILGLGYVGVPAGHIESVERIEHWLGPRCQIVHRCPWLVSPIALSNDAAELAMKQFGR